MGHNRMIPSGLDQMFNFLTVRLEHVLIRDTDDLLCPEHVLDSPRFSALYKCAHCEYYFDVYQIEAWRMGKDPSGYHDIEQIILDSKSFHCRELVIQDIIE